jgi:hypothetical protein
MWSTLFKQKFPVIVVLLGVLLTLLSFFNVEDIRQLKLSVYPTPIYPIFAVGVLLILISIVLFALTESYIDWRFFSKIRTEEDAYSVKIGSSNLRVRFGRIEECEAADASCLVALPANEFFDDECISDQRSALGAYIHKAFPDGVSEIRALIEKQVAGFECSDVEKEHRRFQKSYGIAKCVYLNKPLGSARKILLVSVTTKRKGEGLKTEPHYLFEAISAIETLMADQRLTELHVPVLGAGHGGLRSEMALLYMVLAFVETLPTGSGKKLRTVNIIVFKNDPGSEPQIPKKAVKRILSFASSISSR